MTTDSRRFAVIRRAVALGLTLVLAANSASIAPAGAVAVTEPAGSAALAIRSSAVPGSPTAPAPPAPLGSTPEIVAPPSGGTLPELGVTLTWSNPPSTTQYQVQVIPANNDGPGVDLHVSGAGTSLTVPPPPQWYGLLPDMTYTWRVRASAATTFVALEDPSWSSWVSATFRTPKVESGGIQPLRPRHGGAVTTLTPDLQWENLRNDVFYYEVQLSKDPAFNQDPATATAMVYSALLHGGATSTPNTYTVPASFPLEYGATYAWRVRPRVQGDGVPVNWSDTFTFTSLPHPLAAINWVALLRSEPVVEVTDSTYFVENNPQDRCEPSIFRLLDPQPGGGYTSRAGGLCHSGPTGIRYTTVGSVPIAILTATQGARGGGPGDGSLLVYQAAEGGPRLVARGYGSATVSGSELVLAEDRYDDRFDRMTDARACEFFCIAATRETHYRAQAGVLTQTSVVRRPHVTGAAQTVDVYYQRLFRDAAKGNEERFAEAYALLDPTTQGEQPFAEWRANMSAAVGFEVKFRWNEFRTSFDQNRTVVVWLDEFIPTETGGTSHRLTRITWYVTLDETRDRILLRRAEATSLTPEEWRAGM